MIYSCKCKLLIFHYFTGNRKSSFYFKNKLCLFRKLSNEEDFLVNKFSNVAIYDITRSEYKQFLGLSNMSSMEKVDLLRILGKRIKKIRLEKGMAQVDLVSKMQGNIDTTNISRIEAGRTNPTIYSLYRLSEALEVSISELVNFDTKE